MNPIKQKIKQLNQKIIAAMIEAVNDQGDPCELAYPAWLATHSVDTNANVEESIIEVAFKRMNLPAGDPAGDEPVDYVFNSDLGLEVYAVLVINIGGRQFLVGEDYVDGKSIPVVREMKKPISFDGKL